MNVFTQADKRAMLIIFYALEIAVLIYVLLLFLLETFALTEDESLPESNSDLMQFYYLFLLAGILILFFTFRFYIPSIEGKTNTPSDVLSKYLIAFIMVETVALLGLLHGLLQIFMNNENVDWFLTAPFFILTLFFMNYLISTYIKPKYAGLIGKEFESYNPNSTSNIE